MAIARDQSDTDRVRPEYGFDLCEHMECAAGAEARSAEASSSREGFDGSSGEDFACETGRRDGPFPGDESDHGREEVGSALDRFAGLGWNAGDGRRIGVHWQAIRRVRGAGRGYRQDAVAIQDGIERE